MVDAIYTIFLLKFLVLSFSLQYITPNYSIVIYLKEWKRLNKYLKSREYGNTNARYKTYVSCLIFCSFLEGLSILRETQNVLNLIVNSK